MILVYDCPLFSLLSCLGHLCLTALYCDGLWSLKSVSYEHIWILVYMVIIPHFSYFISNSTLCCFVFIKYCSQLIKSRPHEYLKDWHIGYPNCFISLVFYVVFSELVHFISLSLFVFVMALSVYFDVFDLWISLSY